MWVLSAHSRSSSPKPRDRTSITMCSGPATRERSCPTLKCGVTQQVKSTQVNTLITVPPTQGRPDIPTYSCRTWSAQSRHFFFSGQCTLAHLWYRSRRGISRRPSRHVRSTGADRCASFTQPPQEHRRMFVQGSPTARAAHGARTMAITTARGKLCHRIPSSSRQGQTSRMEWTNGHRQWHRRRR